MTSISTNAFMHLNICRMAHYAKDGVAFGLAESYFVFPDKTIEYIKVHSLTGRFWR
ncbi:MAG: hypothetical protein ACLTDF_11670 [Coprococcus sp.]